MDQTIRLCFTWVSTGIPHINRCIGYGSAAPVQDATPK